MSLRMKIFSLMASTIVGIFVLLAAALSAKHKVADQMEHIGRVSLPAVRSMTLLDMMHDGLRATVYEALFARSTRSSDQLKEAQDNLKQMTEDMHRYLTETKDLNVSPVITQQVEHVEPTVHQYTSQAAKVVGAISEGNDAEAQVELQTFVTLFETLEKDLGTLGDNIETAAKQNVEESDQLTKSTTWLLVGVGGLFVVVLGAYGFIFSKKLSLSISTSVTEMNAVRQQLVGASADVNSQGQALAQGASEQAASLEETAAAIEESNAAAKHIADNSRQAAALSQEVVHVCQEGVGSMEQMNEAISSMQAAAHETANIIKIIDEIAFQTNLLALNAAVEAARAGEAGKGFAVVAEEVRNLAQRSSAAAKDTTEKIHRSLALSDQGASLSKQTAELLVAIKARAEKAKGIVEEISSATSEQSLGMDQVNSAVVQLDSVTQLNAASAEELAAAGNEVDSQVRLLSNAIDTLDGIVLGKAGAAMLAGQLTGKHKHDNSNHHRNGAATPEIATASLLQSRAKSEPAQEISPAEIIPLNDQDFAGF